METVILSSSDINAIRLRPLPLLEYQNLGLPLGKRYSSKNLLRLIERRGPREHPRVREFVLVQALDLVVV